MTDNDIELKKWFKIFVIEHDITLQKLSKILGISPAFLSACYSGKRHLTLDIINKLHENFNIPEQDIKFLSQYLSFKRQNFKFSNADLVKLIRIMNKYNISTIDELESLLRKENL